VNKNGDASSPPQQLATPGMTNQEITQFYLYVYDYRITPLDNITTSTEI